MSDLMMSDSVLRKLSGIDEKLAELYQLIVDITQLKSGINNIFNESENKNINLLSKYESNFFNANSEFGKLNTDFSKNLKDLENNKDLFSSLIHQLEQRKDALNKEINLILNNYQNQQEKIDAALVLLNSEKTKNELLKQQLTQAFDGLDSDINHKLEEFKILLQTEISEFQPKTEQKINLVLDKFISDSDNLINSFEYEKKTALNLFTSDAQKSLTDFNLEKNELFSDISLFKDKTKSEIGDFKNKIEQDLSHFEKTKSDEIYNKREEAKKHLSQKIDSRLDKITEEQSTFLDRQNRLIQQQKTLIDNLSSQVDSLQRIYERDKKEKTDAINKLSNDIQEKTKNMELKIEEFNKGLYKDVKEYVTENIKTLTQDTEKYVTEKIKKGKWF